MKKPKISRRLRRIAEKLDRDVALDLAAHTIINIQDQKAVATTLFGLGLFGPARSAGIAALEELGKLVATMNYLAGKLDGLAFVEIAWSHPSKQRSGYLVMILAPLVLRLKHEHSEPTGDDSNTVLYHQLDRHILANVDALVTEMVGRATELQQLVSDIEAGKIELRREDGLYVSASIGDHGELQAQYPRSVSKEDAALVIDLLSALDSDVVGTSLGNLIGQYAGHAGQGTDIVAVALPMLRKMMDDATRHLDQTNNTNLR